MNTLREAMNPLREMGNEIKADLQRATTVAPAQSTPVSDQPSSAIGPGDAGSTGESVPVPAAAVPSVPVASTPPTSAQDVQAKPKAGRKPRAASASSAATGNPAAPAKQPGRSKAAASEAVVAASAEKPKRKTARKGATVATETPDAALKPRATAGKKDTA
jgi:sec-independent protein translocase protein TatB